MSKIFYQKYRPEKFSDIIGQKHIVRTLVNSIKNERLAHAYLFSGPRGTGKTTMARVFARAVNCLNRDKKTADPCCRCPICQGISEGKMLDVIEIDAASHTGVDNIRELRETVQFHPFQAKYKIYIIDEAHMLSTGAFNALLKTLEEPPAYVIFILATTEIHKIPETILSRCQRFDFTRIPLKNILEKLKSIAQKEKVEIESEALELIALSAEGGLRDAESLFSQVLALEDKKITAREVEEILGATRRESWEKFSRFIFAKEKKEALLLLNQIAQEGYDLEIFAKALLTFWRKLMVIGVNPDLGEKFSLEMTKEQLEKTKEMALSVSPKHLITLIELFNEAMRQVKYSFIPQLPLEIAIIKSALPSEKFNETENLDSKKDYSPLIKEKMSEKKPPKQKFFEEKKEINIENRASVDAKTKISPTENFPVDKDKNMNKKYSLTPDKIKKVWKNFLEEIENINYSLVAILSKVRILDAKENQIILEVKYKFHKERCDDPVNKLTIEKVFDKLLKLKTKVIFVTAEKKETELEKTEIATKESDLSLDDALKIMGGKLI